MGGCPLCPPPGKLNGIFNFLFIVINLLTNIHIIIAALCEVRLSLQGSLTYKLRMEYG